MNKKINPLLISAGFALLLVMLLGTSVFYTVAPGEKAVVFHRIGILGEPGLDKVNIKGQGFHFILPWDEKYIYNVRIQEDLSIMEVLSKNGLTFSYCS